MFGDVLESIQENLESLETELLRAEDNLKQGAEDRNGVHQMFRFAHNVKGAFGMMGYEDCQSLVHHLETSLDYVRQGKGVMTKELVDACLHSVSALLQYLGGNTDPSPLHSLVEVFKQIAANQLAGGQVAKASVRCDLSVEQFKRFIQCDAKSFKYYRIEKVITSTISENDFNNLPLYEDIAQVGTHIVTLPDYSAIRRDNTEETLQVIFGSQKTYDELGNSIFDTFAEINFSPKVKVEKSAASEATLKKVSGQTQIANARSRILIVEDEVTTRLTLQRCLEKYGECVCVNDGFEGLIAYSLALEEGVPFDLICLDIMMPNLDGNEVLRQVRKAEDDREVNSLQRSAKVIMITSEDSSESVLGSFREGCEGYIVKPVKFEQLEATVTKVLKKESVSSLSTK